MSKTRLTLLRTLVTERLSAAVELILTSAERTTLGFNRDVSPKEHKLHTAVERRQLNMLQSGGTEVPLQRVVVTEQLRAAADAIMVLVERVMAEFQEEAVRSKQEVDRQRKLLDIILQPQIKLHRADSLRDNVSVCDEDNSVVPGLCWSPVPSHEEEGPDSLQTGEELCSRDLQPLSSDCSIADGEENKGEEREGGGSDDEWREQGHRLTLTTVTRQKRKKKAEKLKKKTATSSEKITNPAESKSHNPRAKIKRVPPFCCKVCGQSFCYEGPLWKHVQKHDMGTDVCGVCGRRFESEESLRLHLKTYVRTNVLVTHAKIHTKEKPYVCTHCSKGFSRRESLTNHLRIHTGKLLCCSDCGRMFNANRSLKAHMRVHSGERPYVCTVCGKAFVRSSSLVGHARVHTRERPYGCGVCGKRFSQNWSLKIHAMIHTGQRTHACSLCEKTFYKSEALKVHLRTHTGEKPHLCNECGCVFSRRGAFMRHMIAHTQKRAYCCTVCDKSYPREDHLRNHMKKHTGDIIPVDPLVPVDPLIPVGGGRPLIVADPRRLGGAAD